MIFIILYKGLLISADAVSTPYSYRTCAFHITTPDGETYCSEYEFVDVESATLVPPFSYSNQCGSVVLTSYIPVFLLGYSIQLVLSLLLLGSLVSLRYDSVSPLIRKSLHGILWPEQWVRGSDARSCDSDSTVMLNTPTIFCNDVFNNWLLMMTFGLCSPILAVAIVCSVVLKMSLWILLIGRFTKCLLDCDNALGVPGSDATKTSADTPDPATGPLRSSGTILSDNFIDASKKKNVVHGPLASLAKMYVPLFEVLSGSFWLLLWCSALFVALLAWDMAMDEVGWLRSVWIPLTPPGYVLLLRCVAYLNACTRGSKQSMLAVQGEGCCVSHAESSL